MRNFIVNAILGVAAVQGVSTSSMLQTESMSYYSGRLSDKITAGDSILVSCPYTDSRSDRLHDRVRVRIHGIQTATADAKTDDTTTFYFDFEDMGLDDNTI